jgi:hypothetical protein
MLNSSVIIACGNDVLSAFGEDEYNWLRSKIDAMWEQLDTDGGFECVDNFRCCLKGHAQSVELYFEAMDQGCCGSYDTEFGVSPLGHTYGYGFNYGH